jgi:hypothetical protein
MGRFVEGLSQTERLGRTASSLEMFVNPANNARRYSTLISGISGSLGGAGRVKFSAAASWSTHAGWYQMIK